MPDFPVGVCRFSDVLPLLPCRAAGRVPQNAQSVIVALFAYYTGEYAARNVARYACGNDYHGICAELLRALAQEYQARYPAGSFAVFVDNSPIPEVRAAELAGLGEVGKHGMLLHEKYGSRVFIGTIVTDIPLAPTPKSSQSLCSGCNRCIAECPTGALAAGKPLNRALCRSAISQKKGELTGWEQEQLRQGGLIWGCDLCTDACPRNKPVLTLLADFYKDRLPVVTRENLVEALTKKAYAYREQAVRRNLLLQMDSGR